MPSSYLYQRAWRARRKGVGFCRFCKRPIFKGGFCRGHYGQMLQNACEWRANKKAQGLCVRCGHRAPEFGYIICEVCTLRERCRTMAKKNPSQAFKALWSSLKRVAERILKFRLLEALEGDRRNINRAAKRLGMTRREFTRLLERLDAVVV